MSKELNDSKGILNKGDDQTIEIVIEKKDDFNGFGIKIAKPELVMFPVVTEITANSPAESSELKVGDEIVEINSQQIINETYARIANHIKNSTKILHLLIRRKNEKGHDHETEFTPENEKFLTNFSS